MPAPSPLLHDRSPAATEQPPVADRPIVLVGLMGVGKSTVGKRLAQRLGRNFVDSDHEVEAAARLSIPEIFSRWGEAIFRDGERRVIARLVEGTPKVIATGGGAFMNAETRALVLARATVVWLDADVAVLADRVRRRPGARPLLAGRNPAEALAELAAVRNPVYAQAHVHIRSEPLPHATTVEAIIRAIGR